MGEQFRKGFYRTLSDGTCLLRLAQGEHQLLAGINIDFYENSEIL